ncbi:SDR family oxidoreductase [Spirosoma sp. SC4-14]|uniref:SDR family oxidoreductase n=1 Tax=Spirosoma sp. SC4-14 TaxID=3128900 RepID=UPI0030CDEFED
MADTSKVALVTGGSKGIGYGIAEALVQQGVHVAITGRSADGVQAAAEALNKIRPASALGIMADVRDLVSQQQAVDTLLKQWNRLDYVIANAGVGHFASIQELTPEMWLETIDTNLTGVFYSAKATIAALKETQGYFITISSLAGTNFFEKASAYNASKFGLVGFSQAIMLDLRSEGIKVTTIMPGSVATHFNNHEPNENDAWKIQPEDIGQLVIDLIRMPARTLPSKIEVRPSRPGGK